MKKKRNNRNKLTIVIIAMVLLISIGYAALTTVLKINSDILLGKVTFAIHFDNVAALSGKAEVSTAAHITNEAKTEISFGIAMRNLEDDYLFTTDIVNEGSIPGKIKSIVLEGLTDSQKKLIKYKAYYTNSSKELAIGDYFGPYSSKNVTVEVIYQLADDINDEDLPEDELPVNCSFIINFENGTLSEFRARAASSKLTQDTQYMNSNALDFSRAASSTEYSGLYILDSTKDDDFPIYFYRGGSTISNNVVFSGYCWRILRTTDTGGIKIIYNGTPNEDGQCLTTTGENTRINVMSWGSNNNYSNTAIKTYLESWYFSNIIKNQAYIEDTTYCNGHVYSEVNHDLSCESSDSYSVKNSKLTYPIALITVAEANLCGLSGSSSSYPWLHTGENYYTMTGNSYYNDYSWVISNGSYVKSQSLYSYGTSLTSMGIRPVITLNSETELYDGDGSQANPYKVRL